MHTVTNSRAEIENQISASQLRRQVSRDTRTIRGPPSPRRSCHAGSSAASGSAELPPGPSQAEPCASHCRCPGEGRARPPCLQPVPLVRRAGLRSHPAPPTSDTGRVHTVLTPIRASGRVCQGGKGQRHAGPLAHSCTPGGRGGAQVWAPTVWPRDPALGSRPLGSEAPFPHSPSETPGPAECWLQVPERPSRLQSGGGSAKAEAWGPCTRGGRGVRLFLRA